MKKYLILSVILTFFCMAQALRAQDTLIYEQFTENRNNWPESDNNRFSRTVIKGVYLLQNKMDAGAIESIINTDIVQEADFHILAKIRKKSGPENRAFGIIWGSDRANRFSFVISGEGKYAADALSNGKWTDYIPWTPSEAIITKKEFNTLEILKRGDSLYLSVNSKQLAVIPADPFFGQYIGFTLSRQSAMEVDELLIRYMPEPKIPVIAVKTFVTGDSSTFVGLNQKEDHLKKIADERYNTPSRKLAVYEAYLIMHPKSAEAYYNRAQVFLEETDTLKAIRDLNLSVEADSTFSQSYKMRAKLYTAVGERRKALSDYQRYLKLNPRDLGANYEAGVLNFDALSYGEALFYINTVLDADTSHINAYLLRGKIFEIINKPADAMRDYEAVLKLDPANAEAKKRIENLVRRPEREEFKENEKK